MSSKPLKVPNPADLQFEDYTVAWIAPLEIEYQAACYMLDEEHDGNFPSSRGDDYIYTAGTINNHNVVIATFPAGHDYGVGSAAALASQVKKSFPNLWFGLLVGVAAGLPDLSRKPPRDIRLGDVLVGVGEEGKAGLVSYGLGKETADGFHLLHPGMEAKTETVVRAVIGKIRAEFPRKGNVFLKYFDLMKDKRHKYGSFCDIGQEKDQLFQPKSNDGELVTSFAERPLRTADDRTQVWYGSIGSGDRLIKNARIRDKLRDDFDLIGLEMEGAGVISTIPVGVIRGVCGYGDAQKHEQWQPYAAALAAAYACDILHRISPKENRRRHRLEAQDGFREESMSAASSTGSFVHPPHGVNHLVERTGSTPRIKQRFYMYSEECRAALASLDVPQTRSRFEQVDPSLQNTFDWIYENAELGFDLWLKNGTRLYWIQGNPASGKSTLMKFAFNDPRTLRAFAQADEKIVPVAFFFHDRGANIQKSFEGLLKGILFQILSSVPELLPEIMLACPSIPSRGKPNWGLDQLLRAFDCILSQNECPVRIHLFLDALDEYVGKYEDMTRFLFKIRDGQPHSKTIMNVCFSSRPLQIFLDKFKGVPGFRLQDHTEHDISSLIMARLEENERFFEYLHSSNDSDRQAIENIGKEISKRADGVFLWVKLVLDDIEEEFRAGADLQKLHEYLLMIPTDLKIYYQRIFDKIPLRYHDESQIMFAIVACALNPLPLHDFIWAFKYAPVEKLAHCVSSGKGSDGNFLDGADRLIRSRSGGLIEIKAVAEEESNYSLSLGGNDGHIVQFIHQTVKTFSQGTVVSRKHNGYNYLLKFILAYVVRVKPSEPWFHDTSIFKWMETLISCANLSEVTSGSSLKPLLTQVQDKQISSFYSHGMWVAEMKFPLIESLLAFAVVANLQLFLAEHCTAEAVRKKLDTPLLHLAVHERLSDMMLFPNSAELDQGYKRAAVVKLLLEHGADPTALAQKKTAFQAFLTSERDGPADIEILETFLKHSQDPNISITYSERLGKRYQVDRWTTPLHVVVKAGDPESATCLLRYGAKVNALDSEDRTPLDVLCNHLGNRVEHFLRLTSQMSTARLNMARSERELDFSSDRTPNSEALILPSVFSIIYLLLANGAKRSFKDFTESIYEPYHFEEEVRITADDVTKLQDLGLDVDDRIIDFPRLGMGLPTRLLNIFSR